jgi:orotidine-5'-phosphate decarboxylase
MGFDSVEPFLRWADRGAFVLCRTSNPGGDELQALALADGGDGHERLYERIARLAAGPWNRNGQLGLVVGATYPAELARVRALAPTLPLLVPGVGAQGGDAAAVVRAGWREDGALVVNSSRALLYASDGADFAAAARAAAQATRAALDGALADALRAARQAARA